MPNSDRKRSINGNACRKIMFSRNGHHIELNQINLVSQAIADDDAEVRARLARYQQEERWREYPAVDLYDT